MPLHTFRRARKFADSLSKMANKMAHRQQWQPRSIRQFVNALACGKLSKLGARHRVPQSLMNGWQSAGVSARSRARSRASARRRSRAQPLPEGEPRCCNPYLVYIVFAAAVGLGNCLPVAQLQLLPLPTSPSRCSSPNSHARAPNKALQANQSRQHFEVVQQQFPGSPLPAPCEFV